MKCFIDNNTDGNRTFLLYGRLNDIFCPTIKELEFDELLNSILKDRGYRHVVFYGGAGNYGKHCYDEESSQFFFGDRTVSSTASLPSPAGSGNYSSDFSVPNPPRRRRNIPRGNRGTVSSSPEDDTAPQRPAGETPSEPAAETEAQTEPALTFSQVDISNSEFIREITKYINDGEKFAVVFYNIFDFIGGNDGTNRQFIDQITALMDRPSCNAICIFEAPSDPDISVLHDSLVRSPLCYKFTRSVRDPVLNRFNCIRVGTPGEDEIANLLRRSSNKLIQRSEGSLPIKFDYSKLDEYAHLLSHEAELDCSSDISLYRIKVKLNEWILKNSDRTVDGAVPFDDLSPAEIFGRIESDAEIEERRKPPIEKLNIPGWENVYNHISNILKLRHKQYENYKDRLPKKEPDICVSRLAGNSVSGTNKGLTAIPNFVLTGNPGTGKTEIGTLLADILYSEHILPTSKFKKVGKAELTSSLVAGIPRAVMQCADEAEGGVLLIDEAPQIADKDGGLNNEGSGPEVIQTLNRIMTDPTRHICVVLTGYKEGMEKLFAIDPGFRSRFGDNEIHIDDYKPPLLTDIFKRSLKNVNGIEYTLARDIYDPELAESSPDEKQPLNYYMEHLYQKRDRRTFGNARDMKNLTHILASRIAKTDRNELIRSDFFGPAPFSVKDTDDPDYVDSSWFEPIDPEESMDALIRDIKENYVGLDYIADRFLQIEARVREERELHGADSVDKLRMRSFVFVGNPGTGKDVLADLLARLLRILGVLNSPTAIKKDGNDLASSYAGGSVTEAKNWVKEARERNALLFINEAHQLCNEHFDGKGALRTFIAPMTDKNQFISAFAVYPNELENFYKLDSGLKSRLEHIYLKDYTDKELFEIFKVMCKKLDRDPSNVLNLVSKICLRVYREHQFNDGNARMMEILLKDMEDRRIARCNANNIPFTDENGNLNPQRLAFAEEDIPEQWLVRLPDRGCDEDVSDFEEIKRKLNNEIVGRESLSDSFELLSTSVQEAKALSAMGKKVSVMPRPIILVGNPGSGKTAIGRLLAQLYNSLGIVRSSDPYTFDASALTSTYVNGVRSEAEKHINAALEKHSLLFVDEAHQLLDQYDGKGAIQAFISPMNNPDPEKRLVLVFAVYKDRLQEFLDADNGLFRRATIIELPDYNAEELEEIFKHMAKKQYAELSPDLLPALKPVFRNLEERQRNNIQSGNAGMLERLIEDLQNARRSRCRSSGIDISDSKYWIIRPEDIPENYLNNDNQ